MPSILESFGLDSREYQLGKQKVEHGLKYFNVTWSDVVSNLEQACTAKKHIIRIGSYDKPNKTSHSPYFPVRS